MNYFWEAVAWRYSSELRSLLEKCSHDCFSMNFGKIWGPDFLSYFFEQPVLIFVETDSCQIFTDNFWLASYIRSFPSKN